MRSFEPQVVSGQKSDIVKGPVKNDFSFFHKPAASHLADQPVLHDSPVSGNVDVVINQAYIETICKRLFSSDGSERKD